VQFLTEGSGIISH